MVIPATGGAAMATQSEQLEQQARQQRDRISETIEALRDRMTPGQVVDQVANYAQEGRAAEFLGNLGREVRENPLPLTLIAIGVAWLIIASSLSSRARAQKASGKAGRNEHSRDRAIDPVIRLERSDEIAAVIAPPGDGEKWRGARLQGTPAMEQAHEG
jgi:hypothetical protein